MICLPTDNDTISHSEIKWVSSQNNEHFYCNNDDVTRLEIEQQSRIKAEQEQRLKALYEAKTKMTKEVKYQNRVETNISLDQTSQSNQYSSPEEEYEARIRADEEARRKAQIKSIDDLSNLRLEAEQNARIKAQQEARFKALYEAKLQKGSNHN